MKTKTIIISTVAAVAGTFVTHSCLAVATSSFGVAVIKRILLGGISKGMGVFKNRDSFLQNNLIDKALPTELQNINTVLEKIVPTLVAKEREYIAEAAAYTVKISEPILVDAVQGLTEKDVTRIAQGGSGMATQVLKEKTSGQLIAAIMPKVDEKLNEFGLIKTLNNALNSNSLLGSFLGGGHSVSAESVSRLASEQMVNGLFNIVEDYEKQNSAQLYKALGK